jgi:ABC-type multidrug transport system fused ATPase/permease subunit
MNESNNGERLVSENFQAEMLISQIREEFGRVVYTTVARHKQADRLLKGDKTMRIIQIILSVVSISGIFGVIFSAGALQIVSAVFSFLLLLVNMIMLKSSDQQQAQQQREAAEQLWLIREEYKSLLTDFSSLGLEKVRAKRDELQRRTNKINSNAPSVDEKSYKQAQKAIKEQDEQSFSDKEIDDLLPESLRRTKQ